MKADHEVDYQILGQGLEKEQDELLNNFGDNVRGRLVRARAELAQEDRALDRELEKGGLRAAEGEGRKERKG